MDHRAIEIHINLARHDNGIVDRIGAMVAWRNTWAKADDRNTVPSEIVVPIFLPDGSNSASLLMGKPSLDQMTL
jgi:alkylhydroperoxidase family enzyme